jgi:prepilin-type N-terminal cleavage/methylation domain-containing protein
MKNQKGFTLIELLLVLAIIGIISAIAIPALLSQRSRARDKAATSNMTGRMGDMIGQYDKLRELGGSGGTTAITSGLKTYITQTTANDKNPWDPSALAFIASNITGAAGTYSTGSLAAAGAATLGSGCGLGVVKFKLSYPTASTPGFIIGAVGVQNAINGKKYVTKVSSIE